MKNLILISIICMALVGCANATVPVDSTFAKPTPPSCVGMNYAIKGVVYTGSVDRANTLSGVPVSFSQTSWCSPTAGGQTAYTAEDGSFEFKVYIHDTDTFDFWVEVEGYDLASARRVGFDYLAGNRSSVELVLQPKETSAELAQTWQEDIDQLSALLSSQKTPQHLLVQKPILQGDEFDIMSVFEILGHISMAEGYQLSYVYSYDPMGSSPWLYAHSTDKAPFTSASEYFAEWPECSSRKDMPTHCDPMQYVVADGSGLGYLEWFLLYATGDHFYLDWHANIKDATFIATNEALDELVTQLSKTSFGYPLDKDQAEKVRAIGTTPKVSIDDETVTMRVVWFTKWGGFFETEYVLSRTFPYTILITNMDNLLDYNCGVMY